MCAVLYVLAAYCFIYGMNGGVNPSILVLTCTWVIFGFCLVFDSWNPNTIFQYHIHPGLLITEYLLSSHRRGDFPTVYCSALSAAVRGSPSQTQECQSSSFWLQRVLNLQWYSLGFKLHFLYYQQQGIFFVLPAHWQWSMHSHLSLFSHWVIFCIRRNPYIYWIEAQCHCLHWIFSVAVL